MQEKNLKYNNYASNAINWKYNVNLRFSFVGWEESSSNYQSLDENGQYTFTQ